MLFGRIDRIDTNGNQHCIVDYKTGASANQATVDSAEEVQLITYALLDESVDKVFYLNVDESKGVRVGASLSGQELEELKASCRTRLDEIIQMISEGHELQAWGDERTCGYCQYQGICRRPFWSDDPGLRPGP